MFIEFEFPSPFTEPKGLKPKHLRDLKQLVVLAGANGAGKSRYLKLVEEIGTRLAQLDFTEDQIQAWKQMLASLRQSDQPLVDHIRQLEMPLALAAAAHRSIRTGDASLKAIELIPLTYNISWGISDPSDSPPSTIDRLIESNKEGGFQSAFDSVHAYFHEVARAIHDSEHPLHRDSEVFKKRLEDARSFNRVLSALLSSEIEVSLNEQERPIARFRGRPFNPRELSQGELVLAVWAILLHRQREWLRGAVVLIDEPENHLHPDVCIRALEALKSDAILGPKGQIWVATHSVPLIAYAGMESLYFVENGSIEYAGNKVEKVIERLMGGAQGRDRLRGLLADADEIAFDAFAAQCLLPPTVAGPQENDPQQAQMAKLPRTLCANKQDVHLLDFAAGRGRLAVALKEASQSAKQGFTYHAFQDKKYSSDEDYNLHSAHREADFPRILNHGFRGTS